MEVQRTVENWITSEEDAICFSSHTAVLPPPVAADVKVIPLVFVRHPIDRVESVYSFERKQVSDGYGPTLAKNNDLKGYIEKRLTRDNQCRDFHVNFLSNFVNDESRPPLERALQAIEELSFVGLVEDFDKSLDKLSRLLEKEGFGKKKFKSILKNSSRDMTRSLGTRLDNIRSEIGEADYRKLVEANKNDLELYNRVIKKFTCA